MREAMAGRTGIRECHDLLLAEGYEMPTKTAAALVPGLGGGDVPGERSRAMVFALAAAEESLRDAGLADERNALALLPTIDPDRVGVVAGTAAPSADLYFAVSRQALVDGTAAITGRTAPNLSAAAPAAAIALRHGLRGPNFAVSAACASGALAVLTAMDQIRAGRADLIVAVAAESAVTGIGLTSFERAGALADECRPFDRNRRGLVFGEGAAAFVVESEAHARARGARPLAQLLGGALTDDAHHMWAPEVGSWSRTMSLALADAGVSAADVSYVCAHAAGTKLGDSTEVAALRKALGPFADEVPVWSTKGLHGHALGAAGAIELLIAIKALRAGRVPQTVGLSEPDPDCSLDHVPDAGRTGRPGLVLKDSFGFGGTNCVLAVNVLEDAQ
jgi:nodulation protein E